MFHKRSWFPFAVLFLSLVLGVFVFFSFYTKQTQTISQTQPTRISDVTYQHELTSNVTSFLDAYPKAIDDSARYNLVQTMLNQLLRMRVPAQEKDLHLELALSLQQMKEGLYNHSPQDVADGFARFKDAVSQTSWLHL